MPGSFLHAASRTPRIDRSASPVRVLIAAAALLSAGCAPEPAEQSEASPAPRPVQVAEVRASEAVERIRLPGALRSRDRADLAFLHDGTLQDRLVGLGQRVAQGQALATLYNPALQPGVAAAEADVREARTRLEQLETDTRRQRTLVERNLISEDDLEQTRTRRDAARAALEQAQARLEQARAQLDDAALRAPFAGVVTRFAAEPGDFVRAGQVVMSVADPDELEVEVFVRPASAARLAESDPAGVVVQDQGIRLDATVREIGRAEPGRPVPLVVALDPADVSSVSPGAPVHVLLELAGEARPTVPLGAVIDPGTGYARLFRVDGDRAEEVSVQLGRLASGWVEIHGPLAPGDRVVVAGQAHLLDGEPVRVLP